MSTRVQKSKATSAASDEKEKHLQVSSELHRRLKMRAATLGVPLKDLVQEYLEWAIQKYEKERKGRE